MEFELTPEQQSLGQVARDLFAKLYPTARLRELWEGRPADGEAWGILADVGILGVAVSAEHGGMGGDAVDAVLVLHEAGRALVPEPLLEHAVVFPCALAAQGSREQQDRWLPRVASGEARATVRLDGRPYVADADAADVLLLQEDSGRLSLVPRGGFDHLRVSTEDPTRRLFRVDVDAAACEPLEARGGDRGTSALAALAAAALLNGVAEQMLEASVQHAQTREQFGRPIGAFQAVKHALASVFALLESARAATRYGAYATARRLPDRATASSVAFVQAVDAEAAANTAALQCHGGIGFTWEHPLHWSLKRGRALEHAYASPAAHRAALAEEVLR